MDEDEVATGGRERIGQGRFKEAAKTRNATPLIDRVSEIGVDDERVAELAGLIRRDGSLIFQRVDAAGQALRDDFLDALREAIARDEPAPGLAALDGAIATVRCAEHGHHLVLAALKKCEISAKPIPLRLGAVIAHAETRLAELRALMTSALAAGGPIVMPGGVALSDEHGRPVSADALLTAIVEGLGGTLKMEGHGEKLFGKGGRIELPALPTVSGEDVTLAGPTELLGMSWLRWERLHQTARHLDQDIEALSGSDRPEGCPAEILTVFTRGEEVKLLDWIANERALDREGLSHADMLATTGVATKAKGIDGKVALIPAEWISAEEVAQCLSLSEAVGSEVALDMERYGGLRLVQWIRGYAALSAWAGTQPEEGILHISREDLVNLLERMSLTTAEARIFLDATSFGRTSRDLFDAPIVRTKRDWLVVGPAVASQRLARIIPSLLASMDIQIKPKGTAFENRVIAFLKKHGLDARPVKVSRDDAEYQFDALVPWGNRLLLIECKNHTLSGNDPVRAHHFEQGIMDDIEQVQRLAGALEQWPEIVTDEFGPSAAGLEVVPMVLQNETYALPGAHDGVRVYDWSALTRFFEAGWFRVHHDHRINEQVTIRNRVAVRQIWAGDRPSVDDLLAEMDDPNQIAVIAAHSRVQASWFQLDEQTGAINWTVTRLPMTTDSMAEAVGASPESVKAALQAVDDEINANKAEILRRLESAEDAPG